ncbi:carbohydrate kinase family protein [Mucilaginibacter aquariorum]|uniref:Carbohydrate kinase n=1 Tax=Mucilaginibacter aquariorum TaxID=2967225 RepID=A0ABT1T7Z0_9SPHI|nr:carbohydrate kinase [Mucilaginibacter aquariorum]MCQ6960752.1 carbohydrate kinase [Mucilaginibacter aquariorum]
MTPAICFGEILWDVLPAGKQPGGAPLNVAYHLNKLGLNTGIISRIGADPQGQELENLITGWGITTEFLQKDQQNATSEVIARFNGNEVTYEILSPVAWDFIGEGDVENIKANPPKYLVYGSLASRNPTTRKSLFNLLETNAIKVFDINMRPPFVSHELLEHLLQQADIVKFNESELAMVQILFKGSHDSEASRVRFIQEKFNIPEVIVTKGEFGASYYVGETAYHIWGSELKVKDTIGSGDSFLAAFLASHYRNEPPAEILKNAVAMGGFVATQSGGCPPYTLAEFKSFKDKMFAEGILARPSAVNKS